MPRFLRILIFFCPLLPLFAQAQPGNDRVEALRMAFISKRLDLSAQEAEKFWPVYNEYNDKLLAVKRNLRQNFRKRGPDASDIVAEELYRLEQQSHQAEADLHKQYGDKIKTIIGAKKMVKLRLAEEDFKRELIRTIKDQNE